MRATGGRAVSRRAPPALNQPLIAFQASKHAGPLGTELSHCSRSAIRAARSPSLALKKAEDSDEIVLRLQECYGRPAKVRIKFAGPISAVREINAAEESVGAFPLSESELSVDLKPYQPRTLALGLRPAPAPKPGRAAAPLDLPFNLDGISRDDNRADGDFDGRKQTLAGELLPRDLQLGGVPFKFGSSAPGALNVLVPNGQQIPIPGGSYNLLYIIATAVGGDIPVTSGSWGSPAPRQSRSTFENGKDPSAAGIRP